MGRYQREDLWRAAGMIAKTEHVDIAGMDRLADILHGVSIAEDETDPYHSPLSEDEIRRLSESTGVTVSGDTPPRPGAQLLLTIAGWLSGSDYTLLPHVLYENELDEQQILSYVEKGFIVAIPPLRMVPDLLIHDVDIKDIAAGTWNDIAIDGSWSEIQDQKSSIHFPYQYRMVCPNYQFYPETVKLLPGIMHVNKAYPRDQWSWIDYGRFLESPQPELLDNGDGEPMTPTEWLIAEREWQRVAELMGDSI